MFEHSLTLNTVYWLSSHTLVIINRKPFIASMNHPYKFQSSSDDEIPGTAPPSVQHYDDKKTLDGAYLHDVLPHEQPSNVLTADQRMIGSVYLASNTLAGPLTQPTTGTPHDPLPEHQNYAYNGFNEEDEDFQDPPFRLCANKRRSKTTTTPTKSVTASKTRFKKTTVKMLIFKIPLLRLSTMQTTLRKATSPMKLLTIEIDNRLTVPETLLNSAWCNIRIASKPRSRRIYLKMKSRLCLIPQARCRN